MFSRIRKKFVGYKELKYLAYHDSMTGLYNRNWLYKNLDSLQYKYVYFIDINDLKKVNTRGHTYGDVHIKEIVNHLKYRMHSRKDVLIRYAGDEFILFTDENYSMSIETCKFYSVGWCDLSLFSIEECINIADGMMMENKKKFKTKK